MPRDADDSDTEPPRKGRRARAEVGRRARFMGGQGDNSNTQFALLGLWASSRHGFDSDPALEAIDQHFRSSQLSDGRWGYRLGQGGSEAMSCAGLMGLAIAAARPSLAERQTARARGAALAADKAFVNALRAVGQDARRASVNSDIYYLWSLERVCVALGLRSLGGFDWYAHGATILLERQDDDGGWPHDRWGRFPGTCLALLFLRKANLAFEIERVLRLPGAARESKVIAAGAPGAGDDADSGAPETAQTQPAQAEGAGGAEQPAAPAGAPATGQPSDDVRVIVTGASEQGFPRISVQFEVKRPDGTYLLDARRDEFRVTEEGRDAEIVEFEAPQNTEAIPTTVVLVVDRSLSMEEEDRIAGLKARCTRFWKSCPLARGSPCWRSGRKSIGSRRSRPTASKLQPRSTRSNPTERRDSMTPSRPHSRCSNAKAAAAQSLL